MPTKGKFGGLQARHCKTKAIRLQKRKTRESEKAEARPSGSAGDSASLSLSVSPYSFVAACAFLAERSDVTFLLQAHAVVPNSLFLNRMLKVMDKYFLWLIINFS